MVPDHGEPQEISWRFAGRAYLTVWHGQMYGLRRHILDQWRGRALAAVYVVTLVAFWVVLGWSVALWVTGWLAAVIVVICVLVPAAVVALPLLAGGRGIRGWIDQTASIYVVAIHTRPGRWHAANLSAWPRRGRRAVAFIQRLCEVYIDPAGLTVVATAGDRRLYDEIYRHCGFTAVTGGTRPKMIRHPSQSIRPRVLKLPGGAR